MDIEEFRHAVSLGLGRAVLHVRTPLASSFAEVVLEACLHTKARDPQVEGSRAQYMLDIVRRTGDPSFYTRKVLDALSDEADTWDALQRFQIARLLAQEGSSYARQAMVAAFERNISLSMQDMFAEEFISLDGIPGLLFAMERIGRGLSADPERWVDHYLLSLAEDTYGKEAVSNAVTERAKIDKNVSNYVEAVEANRLLRHEYQRRSPSSLTYEQIRSMIASDKTEGVLVNWGQAAEPIELELAASDLIRESDSARLRSYLLIFRKRAFPLDCYHLLRLAKMPDGPIPRHALGALENVQNEMVRQLAFRFIEEKSSLRGSAIGLLTYNFRDGDHELARAWCDEESDPEILNEFDRGLPKFFSAHPNGSMESQILTKLYDREPCSHCRCFIVERLLHLNSLPEDLMAESACDSYLETRALVNAQ